MKDQSIHDIKSNIRETREHINETLHELQERVEAVKTDLEERRSQLNDTVHRVEGKVQQVREAGRKMAEWPVEQTRQRPLVAVGVAIGVGFLMARFLAPPVGRKLGEVSDDMADALSHTPEALSHLPGRLARPARRVPGMLARPALNAGKSIIMSAIQSALMGLVVQKTQQRQQQGRSQDTAARQPYPTDVPAASF